MIFVSGLCDLSALSEADGKKISGKKSCFLTALH